MRNLALLYGLVTVVLTPQLWADLGPKAVRVARAGVTTLTGRAGGLNVVVRIRTRPPRKSPGGGQPEFLDASRCTGPMDLCSIAESLGITVQGKTVDVPLSVYCDLGNINYAELAISEPNSVLTLTGGDASTSYIVKIEFDQEMVKHRIVMAGEFPEHKVQETIYYPPIVPTN